jgi:hypothetical protein
MTAETLGLLDFLQSRIAKVRILPTTTDDELCRLELDLLQAAEIVHSVREDLLHEQMRRRNAGTP